MSKLYTEEQLRDAIAFGRPNISDLTIDDWIKRLTPIELPSDEEIVSEVSKLQFSKDGYKGGVIEGMIWMRDKIKGGEQ